MRLLLHRKLPLGYSLCDPLRVGCLFVIDLDTFVTRGMISGAFSVSGLAARLLSIWIGLSLLGLINGAFFRGILQRKTGNTLTMDKSKRPVSAVVSRNASCRGGRVLEWRDGAGPVVIEFLSLRIKNIRTGRKTCKTYQFRGEFCCWDYTEARFLSKPLSKDSQALRQKLLIVREHPSLRGSIGNLNVRFVDECEIFDIKCSWLHRCGYSGSSTSFMANRLLF
ncbi:hypothetical protein GOP47_0003058 [Adiantum capillus-veneris]|uniref:Uncharacterized protein n=1 Tax=Adiantum capillus-veneris TaxID=13818 RepID=A0A9D4VC34_ADICA|nr:hypothetical protein GOP47_0003058 [Adiantum capillus-veneris]